MGTEVTDALDAAPPAPGPSEDRLAAVRDAVRRTRDLQVNKLDIEGRLREVNLQINDLAHRHLPTLFNEVGVDELVLSADGNLPAYEARLRPYFKANIAAEWDAERQRAGFELLGDLGLDSIIRTRFTVDFGRGEHEQAAAFEAMLVGAKVAYSRGLAVPWNTLTAAVREIYQAGRSLSPPELEKIGATVGQVVSLSERKK